MYFQVVTVSHSLERPNADLGDTVVSPVLHRVSARCPVLHLYGYVHVPVNYEIQDTTHPSTNAPREGITATQLNRNSNDVTEHATSDEHGTSSGEKPQPSPSPEPLSQGRRGLQSSIGVAVGIVGSSEGGDRAVHALTHSADTTAPGGRRSSARFGSRYVQRRACLHVHGAYPTFLLPQYDRNVSAEQLAAQLEAVVVRVLTKQGISLPGGQLVHDVRLVRRYSIYGYRPHPYVFYEVRLVDPNMQQRVVELLQNTREVGGRQWQLYDAQVKFHSQFMVRARVNGVAPFAVPAERCHVRLPTAVELRHPLSSVSATISHSPQLAERQVEERGVQGDARSGLKASAKPTTTPASHTSCSISGSELVFLRWWRADELGKMTTAEVELDISAADLLAVQEESGPGSDTMNATDASGTVDSTSSPPINASAAAATLTTASALPVQRSAAARRGVSAAGDNLSYTRRVIRQYFAENGVRDALRVADTIAMEQHLLSTAHMAHLRNTVKGEDRTEGNAVALRYGHVAQLQRADPTVRWLRDRMLAYLADRRAAVSSSHTGVKVQPAWKTEGAEESVSPIPPAFFSEATGVGVTAAAQDGEDDRIGTAEQQAEQRAIRQQLVASYRLRGRGGGAGSVASTHTGRGYTSAHQPVPSAPLRPTFETLLIRRAETSTAAPHLTDSVAMGCAGEGTSYIGYSCESLQMTPSQGEGETQPSLPSTQRLMVALVEPLEDGTRISDSIVDSQPSAHKREAVPATSTQELIGALGDGYSPVGVASLENPTTIADGGTDSPSYPGSNYPVLTPIHSSPLPPRKKSGRSEVSKFRAAMDALNTAPPAPSSPAASSTSASSWSFWSSVSSSSSSVSTSCDGEGRRVEANPRKKARSEVVESVSEKRSEYLGNTTPSAASTQPLQEDGMDTSSGVEWTTWREEKADTITAVASVRECSIAPLLDDELTQRLDDAALPFGSASPYSALSAKRHPPRTLSESESDGQTPLLRTSDQWNAEEGLETRTSVPARVPALQAASLSSSPRNVLLGGPSYTIGDCVAFARVYPLASHAETCTDMSTSPRIHLDCLTGSPHAPAPEDRVTRCEVLAMARIAALTDTTVCLQWLMALSETHLAVEEKTLAERGAWLPVLPAVEVSMNLSHAPQLTTPIVRLGEMLLSDVYETVLKSLLSSGNSRSLESRRAATSAVRDQQVARNSGWDTTMRTSGVDSCSSASSEWSSYSALSDRANDRPTETLVAAAEVQVWPVRCCSSAQDYHTTPTSLTFTPSSFETRDSSSLLQLPLNPLLCVLCRYQYRLRARVLSDATSFFVPPTPSVQRYPFNSGESGDREEGLSMCTGTSARSAVSVSRRGRRSRRTSVREVFTQPQRLPSVADPTITGDTSAAVKRSCETEVPVMIVQSQEAALSEDVDEEDVLLLSGDKPSFCEGGDPVMKSISSSDTDTSSTSSRKWDCIARRHEPTWQALCAFRQAVAAAPAVLYFSIRTAAVAAEEVLVRGVRIPRRVGELRRRLVDALRSQELCRAQLPSEELQARPQDEEEDNAATKERQPNTQDGVRKEVRFSQLPRAASSPLPSLDFCPRDGKTHTEAVPRDTQRSCDTDGPPLTWTPLHHTDGEGDGLLAGLSPTSLSALGTSATMDRKPDHREGQVEIEVIDGTQCSVIPQLSDASSTVASSGVKAPRSATEAQRSVLQVLREGGDGQEYMVVQREGALGPVMDGLSRLFTVSATAPAQKTGAEPRRSPVTAQPTPSSGATGPELNRGPGGKTRRPQAGGGVRVSAVTWPWLVGEDTDSAGGRCPPYYECLRALAQMSPVADPPLPIPCPPAATQREKPAPAAPSLTNTSRAPSSRVTSQSLSTHRQPQQYLQCVLRVLYVEVLLHRYAGEEQVSSSAILAVGIGQATSARDSCVRVRLFTVPLGDPSDKAAATSAVRQCGQQLRSLSGAVQVVTMEDEAALLCRVRDEIRSYDPDVILSWEGYKYGLGLLSLRYEAVLQRSLSADLSRMRSQHHQHFYSRRARGGTAVGEGQEEKERKPSSREPAAGMMGGPAPGPNRGTAEGGVHMRAVASLQPSNPTVSPLLHPRDPRTRQATTVHSSASSSSSSAALNDSGDDSGEEDGEGTNGGGGGFSAGAGGVQQGRGIPLPPEEWTRTGSWVGRQQRVHPAHATASTTTTPSYARRFGANVSITGRICTSLGKDLRKDVKLPSYALPMVHLELFGQPLPYFTDTHLAELATAPQDPAAQDVALRYLAARVAAPHRIASRLHWFTKLLEFSRMYGILTEEVLLRGTQFRVEATLLRLAYPLRYAMLSPSMAQVHRQPRLECISLVMQPRADFYRREDPVVVLDFRSLYPSIIIAYNVCYSTCLGMVQPTAYGRLGVLASFKQSDRVLNELLPDDGAQHESVVFSPNGAMFVSPSTRQGLLPRMMQAVLDTRFEVQAALHHIASPTHDTVMQQRLQEQQLALKMLANVTYGYTAASFTGRMPCVDVAEAIVSLGRQTLERAVVLIHGTPAWRAEVVYGDTDSLFIRLAGRTLQEAFVLGQAMADAVTQANPAPIRLQFEKVLCPCLLLVKKRYAGYMWTSPTQTKPTFLAKGIEVVRRDQSPVTAQLATRLLHTLFDGGAPSELREAYYAAVSRLQAGSLNPYQCIFRRSVRLGRYEHSAAGRFPLAARLALKRMDDDVAETPYWGEFVPYVVVKALHAMDSLSEQVLHPAELLDVADTHLLDADYYIARNINSSLDRMFYLVGISFTQWYQAMPRRRRAHAALLTMETFTKAQEAQEGKTKAPLPPRRARSTSPLPLANTNTADVLHDNDSFEHLNRLAHITVEMQRLLRESADPEFAMRNRDREAVLEEVLSDDDMEEDDGEDAMLSSVPMVVDATQRSVFEVTDVEDFMATQRPSLAGMRGTKEAHLDVLEGKQLTRSAAAAMKRKKQKPRHPTLDSFYPRTRCVVCEKEVVSLEDVRRQRAVLQQHLHYLPTRCTTNTNVPANDLQQPLLLLPPICLRCWSDPAALLLRVQQRSRDVSEQMRSLLSLCGACVHSGGSWGEAVQHGYQQAVADMEDMDAFTGVRLAEDRAIHGGCGSGLASSPVLGAVRVSAEGVPRGCVSVDCAVSFQKKWVAVQWKRWQQIQDFLQRVL